MTSRPRIACFLATSGHSGVDRVARNLLPGLAEAGYAVDLLKIRNHGPNLEGGRGDSLRIIEFNARHVYPALPELVRYLRRARPAVLLTDKDRVNRTAILAHAMSGGKCRLALRNGTTVSVNLASRGAFDRFVQRNSMRHLYRRADAILMPSKGAADDFAATIGLPRERIAVVPSPIITPGFLRQLDQPLDHPWFAPGEPPVILGVGELCRRKDFTTLIRAYAQLAGSHDCRLLILGEGRARDRLQREVERLGLADRVGLPGFVANPYPYMKRASLFVLSSLWEGMPVVLIEAMAAATPVVATDCPSGPAELLGGLSAELLVKPGDAAALARAMAGQLDNPLPGPALTAAVDAYRLENSVAAYLNAMGLPVG
ncbi:MAG: glycosyltransferase [Candidatus Thiodiazotropha sp.]|nr:glycosyltransferase [Candidatus Thiodiazotropha sp. (ex Lucina pensylvanica)]MBT3062482.1 glycosyltransferase [Candidatus Thiodiazotropha sp. (ex Lucina pensylvanica)]PUB75028.1 MAG: glycosyl transferase [gamma proteobacterium symbiont of Ctena orbiculata]PUB78955.1 MAG: glycosyl transferase [gamma proteobacterium symbiont of Ctena orbiculata]